MALSAQDFIMKQFQSNPNPMKAPILGQAKAVPNPGFFMSQFVSFGSRLMPPGLQYESLEKKFAVLIQWFVNPS